MMGHRTGAHGRAVHDRHQAQGCSLAWRNDGCTGSSGTHGKPAQQGSHARIVDLCVCVCVCVCFEVSK